MSISLFMLGCNGSYTDSVICAMAHMYTFYDPFLTIMITKVITTILVSSLYTSPL